MNSEKIIVKNEPVCVYNQSGRPIRFEKRPISTQQNSKADTSKTSSKRSKSLRHQIRGGIIRSEPVEVQVKKEPSADTDNETSSHKCKICQKLFVNLRSLNKHARIHSGEEAKKSGEEPKQKEVKNEPIDLEKYRIKQELERELEDKELEALERRNQPMTTASIAFLRQTDEPAEQPAQIQEPLKAVEPDEQRQDEMTNNRSSETKKTNNTKQHLVKSGKPAATQTRNNRPREENSKRATNKKQDLVKSGKKSYKCECCSKAFNNSYELKVHCRVHTREKPYKFQICKKAFSQSSTLVIHKRIHTGEKPYKCQTCKKTFTDLNHLKRHRRIHTREKPYKCQICKKTFADSSDLVKHSRIHTGEKPYKCEICKKTFSQSNHLKEHNRVHTGEQPYKCQMCKKAFSQSSNLVRHSRIHSGEKL